MDGRDLSAEAEVDLAHAPGFTLGRLSVSPSTREVRWDGSVEIIEPRVMQVLVCLARSDGAVVSRDDLIRRCWGGRIVGEDAINRCIGKVRQIADLPGEPAFVIETIPRVGYRLRSTPGAVPASLPTVAAPVALGRKPHHRRWRLGAAVAIIPLAVLAFVVWTQLRPPVVAPPLLRSVAILPIQNLTGDASLDPAVDRLTEDLMEVTSRGGYILVAPRNATFAWKGRPVDERLVGRDLHVRHVVIASLRRSDARWHVSFQIVDAATGQVVTAHDFDRATADGSFPEGQLSLSLFNAIAPVIYTRWRDDQLARSPDDGDPENLTARVAKLMDDGGRETVGETIRLLDLARRTLPADYGQLPLLAARACWFYSGAVRRGYYASPAERVAWAEAALDSARLAAELRPVTTGPHSCRAEAFGQLERWDEGMAEARYVIDTMPLTAAGYEAKARLELARGRFQEALKDYDELSARDVDTDPDEGYHAEIGLAQLLAGAYDAAIAELRRQQVVDPKAPDGPFFLAAALALTGKHGEAVAAARVYDTLKTDDGLWEMLEQSHEAAFVARAGVVRKALHDAGLDEPASRAAMQAAQASPSQ
jgi:DNA-binding winged helix-turn-helix (wHTH) protein/TolB-like protein/tetratricopeptide (TPR) repeat protein